MRIAVIDLGTNTCNLVIADTTAHSFKRVFNEMYPVLLGAKGINQGKITPEAISRAVSVIKNCLKISKEHKAEKTIAFATSAVRSAKNGVEFANQIKTELGIELQIISGDKEAEYIYKGVKRSAPLSEEKIIILDIGGGSNELIIANNNEVFWKKSYPLGMARINELFIFSDPYSEKEINELEDYFTNEMKDFFLEVEKHKPTTLIGASGSFETFANLLMANDPSIEFSDKESGLLEININEYFSIHKEMISLSTEGRMAMKGMDTIRVEMIALASIFTNTIMKKCNISKLIKTDYSLKEGVLDSLQTS